MAQIDSESITRGEQLRLLREWSHPTVSNVSGSTLKTVLRAVDDHAGERSLCFASCTTIARETGLSSRTVKRATQCLSRLGYLRANLRCGQTTEYRIDWECLSRGHVVTGDMVSPVTWCHPTGDMVSTTGDMVSTTGDMVSPKAQEAPKKAPHKRKPAKRAFDPLGFALPEELATDRFREAWGDWVADRKARGKPLTERAVKKQIDDLVKWGESKAIQAIGNAIKGGWQMPYEPKSYGGKIGAGQSYDAAAKEEFGGGF